MNLEKYGCKKVFNLLTVKKCLLLRIKNLITYKVWIKKKSPNKKWIKNSKICKHHGCTHEEGINTQGDPWALTPPPPLTVFFKFLNHETNI